MIDPRSHYLLLSFQSLFLLPRKKEPDWDLPSVMVLSTAIKGNWRSEAPWEKELIQDTLKKFGGNRTLTAEALNISRKTLFNKMKKYGL